MNRRQQAIRTAHTELTCEDPGRGSHALGDSLSHARAPAAPKRASSSKRPATRKAAKRKAR